MTALNPTRGEIQDALYATEDVPLVVNGALTEAGEFYVSSVRSQTVNP